MFKKFKNDTDSVYYEDLDDDDNYHRGLHNLMKPHYHLKKPFIVI